MEPFSQDTAGISSHFCNSPFFRVIFLFTPIKGAEYTSGLIRLVADNVMKLLTNF